MLSIGDWCLLNQGEGPDCRVCGGDPLAADWLIAEPRNTGSETRSATREPTLHHLLVCHCRGAHGAHPLMLVAVGLALSWGCAPHVLLCIAYGTKYCTLLKVS